MSDPKERKLTDITADKTEHLKAIALILLMIHHLFGCDYLEDWMSVAKGADIIFGVAGRICLAMFLFCSGYGLYKSYISKESTPKTYVPSKILKLLIPYWVVTVVAVVILIVLGKFNPVYIPVNLVAWIHNDEMLYVSFSWYIKLQFLLLLSLPLIRLIERKWKKNWIIDILIYVLLPFVIWFFLRKFENEEIFTDILQTLASSALFFLSWFSLFAMGMIFAKYSVYIKIRKLAGRFPDVLVILLSVVIGGYALFMKYLVNFMFGEVYYYSITDVICMPLFVIACLLVMDSIKHKSRYVLPYLGKNSLYYWLLSGMFFLNTKELMPLITWPKYSILILIWLFVILTPFVFACSFVSDKILGLIFSKKKD